MTFMLGHFGWRAVLAILVAALTYFLPFRRELTELARHTSASDVYEPEDAAEMTSGMLPVPAWITVAHMGFMAWAVGRSRECWRCPARRRRAQMLGVQFFYGRSSEDVLVCLDRHRGEWS